MSYQVGPEDVVVVDRDGQRVPPPGPRGFHAKLRQRRVMIAAGLATIEFLAVAFWHADAFTLVLFGILAIAAYSSPAASCRRAPCARARGSSPSPRDSSRSSSSLIPVTLFFTFLIAVVLLLVLLMRLLGERSRG